MIPQPSVYAYLYAVFFFLPQLSNAEPLGLRLLFLEGRGWRAFDLSSVFFFRILIHTSGLDLGSKMLNPDLITLDHQQNEQDDKSFAPSKTYQQINL